MMAVAARSFCRQNMIALRTYAAAHLSSLRCYREDCLRDAPRSEEEEDSTFVVLEGTFALAAECLGAKFQANNHAGKEMKSKLCCNCRPQSQTIHLPQGPTCVCSPTRSVLQVETHA